jgi:hypothetical protein
VRARRPSTRKAKPQHFSCELVLYIIDIRIKINANGSRQQAATMGTLRDLFLPLQLL